MLFIETSVFCQENTCQENTRVFCQERKDPCYFLLKIGNASIQNGTTQQNNTALQLGGSISSEFLRSHFWLYAVFFN